MLRYDPLTDGETEPGSVAATTKTGPKDFIDIRCCDAAARVMEFHDARPMDLVPTKLTAAH